MLYGEKFGFCEWFAHRKQYGCVTFGDSVLLCPSNQVVEDGDLGVQLELELEYETPIPMGCDGVVLDPIQVLEVQYHGCVPNLDIRPLVRVGFEDMVVDGFSVDESTNMWTKSGFVIDFKGGLDSFSLKEN